MDWDNIRVFLAVARSGQMLAAANRLDMDHATVRRRINALESALGAKLLDRQTTGSRLTLAGEKFYAMAERAEMEIMNGQSSVSGLDGALSGVVRIGAPDGFGTYFLAAELNGFIAQNPHVTVQLVPQPRAFSFSKREADIVIALERPPEQQIVSRKLTDYTLSLYASKGHLKKYGAVKTRGDMSDRTLITYVRDLWYSPSLDYFAEVEDSVVRRYECVSVLGQVEAVRSGLGIGILHDFLATRYSDLERILPEICFTRTYWIATHNDLRGINRVKELVDYIIAQVRLRGAALFRPYAS
ncbi:LysR family transcriptional regulator [Ancylobacter sp. G4_0304]|uniref:LysR family transcriptional regulator n=1 Tax=Ancylobacter sp. G4_0304 TaxID=3114289 RepID=UPI0039C5E5C3